MCRSVFMAVLGVALCSSAVQAQMRGAARPAVAPRVGGRIAPPPRMMPGPARFAMPSRQAGHIGFFFGTPSPGFRFGNPRFRHHHHFFFNSGCFNAFDPFCRGFFPGSQFLYWPLFWPDYSSGYSYGAPPYAVVQQPPSGQYQDESALRGDIDRLTQEVQRLTEAEEARNARGSQVRPAPQLPTVLVFRDGQRQEIQNYGMVGNILWIFTEQHARKISLADIDLPATKAANDSRGIEFVVPQSR